MLFATYIALQRGEIVSYDGNVMLSVAKNLVTKHSLLVDPKVDGLHLQHPYASYGFGTIAMLAPFAAVQHWLSPNSDVINTLANPMVVAATGVVIVLVGRRLQWRRSAGIAAALAFGLTTPAVWQSTEAFSEPGTTLGMMIALLGLLTMRDGRRYGAWLLGCGTATAVLFRPDSIALIVAAMLVAAWYFARAGGLLDRGTVLACLLPLAAVGVFQLWYDNFRYGSLFDTGFSHQSRGHGFDTPIMEGLDMLLRSPARGFFWTAPVMLCAIPGIVFLFRRERALALLITVLCVSRLLFFSVWWSPGGGVVWGPRMLFPLTALLAIGLGEFLHRLHARRFAWVAFGVLSAAGAALAYVSVAIPYNWFWAERTKGLTGAPFLAARHTYFFSLRHNVLVGSIRALFHPHPQPLLHFDGGPDGYGIAAMLIAVVAFVALVRPERSARQEFRDTDRGRVAAGEWQEAQQRAEVAGHLDLTAHEPD